MLPPTLSRTATSGLYFLARAKYISTEEKSSIFPALPEKLAGYDYRSSSITYCKTYPQALPVSLNRGLLNQ